jgi:hypothetical protein
MLALLSVASRGVLTRLAAHIPYPARSAYAPQQPEQPEVQEPVRKLGAVARLEVRQQVELAAVVCPVTAAIERNDAVRLVAAAERARNQVGRVNGPPAADDAGLPGDLGALRP